MADEPIQDGTQTEGRDHAGRFAPGNRLSPGRPKGRGAVAELRDKLAQDVDAIVETLRAQALAGDLQAIRIVMDRLVPSLRPVEQPVEVDLPAGSLSQRAEALVDAAAGGELPVAQAVQLVGAIGTVGRLVEMDEVLKRLEALEGRINQERGKV